MIQSKTTRRSTISNPVPSSREVTSSVHQGHLCTPCILCKKGIQSKYFHPKSSKANSLLKKLQEYEPTLGIGPDSCICRVCRNEISDIDNDGFSPRWRKLMQMATVNGTTLQTVQPQPLGLRDATPHGTVEHSSTQSSVGHSTTQGHPSTKSNVGHPTTQSSVVHPSTQFSVSSESSFGHPSTQPSVLTESSVGHPMTQSSVGHLSTFNQSSLTMCTA